ncbi:MAG: hypothetical protein ACFE8A_11715 [Candidatus Hodarchaeota archaeon]
MNENDKYKNVEAESPEEPSRESKPVKKTQGQLLQEALGLKPGDIQEIEKKLFIARFLDYFSEETLDFIYKDRSIEQYKNEMQTFLESITMGDKEEDKLLKKNFEDKQIIEIIYQLKKKGEGTALNKQGIKQPVDKRLRKLSLLTTLPMFIILMLLTLFFIGTITELIWVFIPLLCIFCMIPQLIRGSVLRKWYNFKEENKTAFYTENREDIMILKDYTGDVLDNIRSRLLDMKVPLQLIKFILHSRDYENLKLINQRTVRGTSQYFFSFEYPPEMEPFPIPEILLQQERQIPPERKTPTKPEKNFIVLTEIVGKNGVLTGFLPSLKSTLADKINDTLNNCDFTATTNTFDDIIPNSVNMPIYCLCGEVAEFLSIQICNWKNQFKFYLFEGKECKCGEKIYVLSLMDEDAEIPEELKEIFLS